ncbi:MAG: HI1506-related protein [Ahrensia sp.]|nr:HI1506-related protein [Ahrensia sp.]
MSSFFVIICHRPGFRRFGVEHPRKSVVPETAYSEDQWKTLKDDAVFTVHPASADDLAQLAPEQRINALSLILEKYGKELANKDGSLSPAKLEKAAGFSPTDDEIAQLWSDRKGG